jgi:dTDP-glucose 4,6-dehydratase
LILYRSFGHSTALSKTITTAITSNLNTKSHFNPSSILITGGAGFIGSNFVRYLAKQEAADTRVTVLDKLTYAGNLENLSDCEDYYSFVHGDICDSKLVEQTLKKFAVDTVLHFAAESHVDRSILGPRIFTETNVMGTHSVLEASRQHGIKRFVHVSTDEVYGSLGPEGLFTEQSPIDPTSPYASSKAASDLIVMAYAKTYGFPAMITRCSNNYGPYQFPEKLVPLMIINAMNDKPLPIYGDGKNVRDWIHTDDHASAIWTVIQKGLAGEVYNIGGNSERFNIDIVKLILNALGKPESLITYVKDRLAHDKRYAIDSSKIQNELGWEPSVGFDEGIQSTIDWYRSNENWWQRVMSGEYQKYYEQQYKNR